MSYTEEVRESRENNMLIADDENYLYPTVEITGIIANRSSLSSRLRP